MKKCEIVNVCEFVDLDCDLTRDIREKICGDAIGNGGSAYNDLNAFIGDTLMHCSQYTRA